MNYLIFDCEIENAIPPKDGGRIPGINYCAGWDDYANMGISCISLCWLDRHYQPADPKYRPMVFRFDRPDGDTQKEMAGALLLNAPDIGGFNSRKFDDKLLAANGFKVGQSGRSTFDILDLVLEAAGMADRKYWLEGRRYNLDSICRANGLEKTGSGEMAPLWWQQGDRDKVVEYCRNDAEIERAVLALLLQGRLIDPNDGKKLAAIMFRA